MNLELVNISMGAVVIVPVVVAIVQAFKMTGWVKDKYAPLVSMAVGMVIAFWTNGDVNNFSNSLLNGVLFGLSASGLYSGIKATTNRNETDYK